MPDDGLEGILPSNALHKEDLAFGSQIAVGVVFGIPFQNTCGKSIILRISIKTQPHDSTQEREGLKR